MPSRFWRASGNALLPSRNTLSPSQSAAQLTIQSTSVEIGGIPVEIS